MTRKLKLMAEYGGTVLWSVGGEHPGPIDPATLPLDPALRAAVQAWAETYDRTLNEDDPLDSGFASEVEEEAFDQEGRRLGRRLQDQLGPDWVVTYQSELSGQLHEASRL